jgi:transposase
VCPAVIGDPCHRRAEYLAENIEVWRAPRHETIGRISKAGQADIRRLLIMGAMSRLNWLGRNTISERSWLSRMLARKPRMLVAIALANKMARAIWAMLTKREDYQNPAQAAA